MEDTEYSRDERAQQELVNGYWRRVHRAIEKKDYDELCSVIEGSKHLLRCQLGDWEFAQMKEEAIAMWDERWEEENLFSKRQAREIQDTLEKELGTPFMETTGEQLSVLIKKMERRLEKECPELWREFKKMCAGRRT